MPNLAAKYRPRTWDEVVEQKMVIHMVKGLIDNECMDVRNFLFTGPAGCAKTTICRILANVLNEGKGEPIEIDAASNSGVDNMRVCFMNGSMIEHDGLGITYFSIYILKDMVAC